MENIEENEDSLNTEEEETSTNDNVDEETAEELRERLKKAEEIAENQRIKAEKAEKLAKKPKEEDTSKKSDYSLADIRALSKVHDDDIERVEKFVKSEGVSYAEALKNEDLQAILSSREEKRNTASATNTGTSRRGSSKPTGEKLIEDFENGKMPEDTDALAQARMEQKKARNKRS